MTKITRLLAGTICRLTVSAVTVISSRLNTLLYTLHIKISCARSDKIMPPPFSSPVGASRAAEQTQRSSSFPRPIRSHGYRCIPASRVMAALSKAAWWPWPLTLKMVSESRVTCATAVPIVVFLGLSVLELDRCTPLTRRQTKASLNAPAY